MLPPASDNQRRKQAKRGRAITHRHLTLPSIPKAHMEEIKPADWVAKVYRPDIKNKPDKLYNKPGYDESDL